MVFAILTILITLVAAMHHQQVTVSRNVTRGAADLEFAQGLRFALAEQLGYSEFDPSKVKVRGRIEVVQEADLTPGLYSEFWAGLPDLSVGPETEFPPGCDEVTITPRTLDPTLQIFGRLKVRTVSHSSASFAAYAPNGEIELEEVYGWSNPTFEDEREAPRAFSGVPALIYGGENISVGHLAYGAIYAASPAAAVDKGDGLAIAYVGPPPIKPYAEDLRIGLEQARNELITASGSGNKTAQVKGKVLDTVGSALSLFWGSRDELSLTMEQAFAFPMPTIPSVSQTVPQFPISGLTEFFFHVPYPADGQSFTQGTKESVQRGRDLSTQAMELGDAIQEKNDEIEALEAELANESVPARRTAILLALEKARGELFLLEMELSQVEAEIRRHSQEAIEQVESSASPSSKPITRADDDGFRNNRPPGTSGWNYSAIISNMLGILWDTATLNFEGVARRLYAEVRLVHFGSRTNNPESGWDFGDPFRSRATWTVPRGRTLRFDGNMEITGDLWIQKGAAMSVGGNLTLADPDPDSNSLNPFRPCGRLFLEEGAVLLVDGDLRCAGTSMYGSVLVGSRPGQIRPISSAIFSTGQVDLPYGTFSGTGLEDLVEWLGESNSGVADLNAVLTPLLSTVAPNVAKVSGPFHRREPYFAQYATTFQLTIIPPTIFNPPIPIPTPIPLPERNILNTIFQALTNLYTPALNASLGENLYLQADWWPFTSGGIGSVPMIPKIDPARALGAVSGISLPGLTPVNFENLVQDLVQRGITEAVAQVVKSTIKAVVTEIATKFIPGGRFLNEITDRIVSEVTAQLDRLVGFEDQGESVFGAAVEPLKDAGRDWLNRLEGAARDGAAEGYLREVPGLLIYADRISIGYNDRFLTPEVCSGMFVAQSEVDIASTYTVGTIVCLNGPIRAKRLLYVPFFSRATLYRPRASAGNWLSRAAEVQYGRDFASGLGADVGPDRKTISAQGWTR